MPEMPSPATQVPQPDGVSRRQVFCVAAVPALATTMALGNAGAPTPETPKIHHRMQMINGTNLFYREAGPADAPTLVLLHGFPSSSRIWVPMMLRLSDEFRMIAPDYAGFGHSDAPAPDAFAYTFDNLARMTAALCNSLALNRFTLVMQDYGGPVGFRMALAAPAKIEAMVIQNAVSHAEGLGPLWEARRAFWTDPAGHKAALLANLLSLEANRLRHVGTSPNIDLYDPDMWTDETAFLSRPGMGHVQTALFYDYRTNIAAYPKWQAWLRARRPPLLVTWGVYDPSFVPQGALAYRRDVSDAEIHLLNAGHFPLDEAADQASALTRRFVRRLKRS